MRALTVAVGLAALLWTAMFSPLTAPFVNFWWMMAGSALVLSVLAGRFRRKWRASFRWRAADGPAGVALAAGLWGVFWLGDKLSSLLFAFARPQVDLIYGMKAGESPVLLTVLLLCLIGPAEEIFWRGYVQHELAARLTPDKGFVAATALYALVHVGSCNFMLVMAAAVAGCVWGAFYRFFPNRMWPLVLSHALWDAAVFVWFPI